MWWITCSLKSCKHNCYCYRTKTKPFSPFKLEISPSASHQTKGWGAETRRSPSPVCSTSIEMAAWTTWTRDILVTPRCTLNMASHSYERKTYLFWKTCPNFPQIIKPRFLQPKTGKNKQLLSKSAQHEHLCPSATLKATVWKVWRHRRHLERARKIFPSSVQPNYTHNMDPNERREKNKMWTGQQKRDLQWKTSHLGQTCHKRRQNGKATYIVQSYGSIDKCKQIKHTSPAVDRQEQQCHSFRCA